MDDLARKVVDLPGWCELPGMAAVDANGLQWRRGGASWTGEGHGVRSCRGQMLPVLDDAATAGLLLSLLDGRIELTRDPLGSWRLSDVSGEVYSDTLGRACARLAHLRGHWRRDDAR